MIRLRAPGRNQPAPGRSCPLSRWAFGPTARGYLITVTNQPPDPGLDDLLDEIYVGQERVTQAEIQRRAVAAEMPAQVLTRITAMPQGEYTVDEVAELLGGTAR